MKSFERFGLLLEDDSFWWKSDGERLRGVLFGEGAKDVPIGDMTSLYIALVDIFANAAKTLSSSACRTVDLDFGGERDWDERLGLLGEMGGDRDTLFLRCDNEVSWMLGLREFTEGDSWKLERRWGLFLPELKGLLELLSTKSFLASEASVCRRSLLARSIGDTCSIGVGFADSLRIYPLPYSKDSSLECNAGTCWCNWVAVVGRIRRWLEDILIDAVTAILELVASGESKYWKYSWVIKDSYQSVVRVPVWKTADEDVTPPWSSAMNLPCCKYNLRTVVRLYDDIG